MTPAESYTRLRALMHRLPPLWWLLIWSGTSRRTGRRWVPMRLSCTFGDRARRHPCSRWHFDLVASYRAERERQEQALDDAAYGYPGDRALSLALGTARRPVTFREWLLAHRGGAR